MKTKHAFIAAHASEHAIRFMCRVKQLEVTLLAWHRSNEASRRLATIPGVGVITATALVATIGDGAQFRSGRQLSAWLGLVPRQHSSGGKDRLGRISKRGDGYIRRLLVHGCANRAALAPRQAGHGAWLDRPAPGRGGRQTWCWSPWPIRQPVSPGHCSGTSVSTDRRRHSQLANRDQIARVTTI